jgi:hypothetical protein
VNCSYVATALSHQRSAITPGYNALQLIRQSIDSLRDNEKILFSTTKREVAAISPKLLKLGHTELYKFSKAWKRYINLCKERNAVLLGCHETVPATLFSCIDPDLLENLVCLEDIEGFDDVDKVTDDNLEAWMKKSLGEVAKLTTTDNIYSMVHQNKHAGEGL